MTGMPPEIRPVYAIDGVHDGDTFTCLIEAGLDTLRRVTIRVAEVDTPELGQDHADDATTFTATWLTDALWDHDLAVAFPRTRTGSYRLTFARTVGAPYRPSTGDTLGSQLLRAGLYKRQVEP